MQTLTAHPTEAQVREILEELTRTTGLLGRRLGDGGAPETLAPQPNGNDIAHSLVNAYLAGTGVYVEGAAPGLPPDLSALRSHQFNRSEKAFVYQCEEKLPTLARFAGFGPIADAAPYGGILTPIFTWLGDALKSSLGKPKTKRKQRVEFEWGGHPSEPSWGGVYVTLSQGREIAVGGGDSAPWSPVTLEVQVMGAPRA